MKIVFMGTPEIAATCLKEILRQRHEVAAVYTREDKPVGRKQVLTAPPVKVLAAENRIPIYQPKTLRDTVVQAQLRDMEPDLIVVVAYGRILPPEVLAIPKYGCINLHVSLLPAYRGAAPIQWAVINGDAETGVTVMQMDEGLDTGPIISQCPVEIGPDATAGEMFEIVGPIGARLLAATIEDIEAGRAEALPQQGEASAAPMLSKEMAKLDFNRPAHELHNLARGCNPWPLAWFEHAGQRVKVTDTRYGVLCGRAGEILSLKPLTIGCGDGSLELIGVVPAGARPMKGHEWAAGRRFAAGDILH